MRVLVTGSTDGHGRAVAAELARRGDEVLVHGRDPQRVERVAAEVGAAGAHVADFSSLDEVRRLARELERLDVLVNNAGTITSERRLSADGYELTFAVNHLAGFLLARLLGKRAGRIVNVSSVGQREIDFDDPLLERRWDSYGAYAQSKLAQVMHAFELAERGVDASALHPATLMDTKMVRRTFGRSAASVAEGVEATIAAIDRHDGRGRYFEGLREARAHPQAYDPEARRRLWELSEELTR